jgi:hypothetical protein
VSHINHTCHRVAASHRIVARKERFPDFTSYSFHDYLRIATRSSSSTSTAPSLASSTCTSLRSSPTPSGQYQTAFVAHAPPRFPRVSREFSILGLVSRSIVKIHVLSQQSTNSHLAPLVGRLTSPFAWAMLVWDMSPCLALKCSQTTSRQHRQYLEALISMTLSRHARRDYPCFADLPSLAHKLSSSGMGDE